MSDPAPTVPEVPVNLHDDPFLAAASILRSLVAHPAVADRWDRPSALDRMSVGALACHLGRQTVSAVRILSTPTGVAPLSAARDHYAAAAWVTAPSLDDPANDRSNDDAEAALGHAALVERVDAALRDIRELLTTGSAETVGFVPWQGWSLRRPDFLLTRMLEIVVHSDDLAASIDVPTPEFEDAVFEPVLELLGVLAVRRHGQVSVLRALTRAERAPESIVAF